MSEEQRKYEKVAEELGDTERYEHFENTEHPLTKEMRDTLRTLEEYILNTDIGIAVLADDVCVYIAKTDPFSLEDWGEALIQKCCKYMRRDVVRDVSVDFDDAVQMMTLDNRYAYVMRKSEKQKGLDPVPMVDGWDTIERACAAGIVYGFALTPVYTLPSAVVSPTVTDTVNPSLLSSSILNLVPAGRSQMDNCSSFLTKIS